MMLVAQAPLPQPGPHSPLHHLDDPMPPALPPPALTATFRSLADVVYSEESFEEVARAICLAAVDLVDGCDHASLMVRRGNRAVTAAASDDVAARCDDLERAVGQGPCLDALDEDAPHQHVCADLHDGGSWPDLATRMIDETPVRGLAGFRLRHEGAKVGALNIFGDHPDRLDEESLHQATLLTAFASVSLAAMDRGEQATTLRRGLDSNREIGKAVGLLMAMHDLDQDAAFAMLSRVSQEMNLKLAEVASRVVDTHRPGA